MIDTVKDFWNNAIIGEYHANMYITWFPDLKQSIEWFVNSFNEKMFSRDKAL
jgi:hypothetical protein